MATLRALGKDPSGNDCPMVMAINLVAGKWAVPILWHLLLAGKPLRFTEIRRLVPPVTQKELTKQLRLFEEQGLTMRKVHPAASLHVEYEATPLGRSLYGALETLRLWMVEHADEMRQMKRMPQACS